jgi:hypothetical protein
MIIKYLKFIIQIRSDLIVRLCDLTDKIILYYVKIKYKKFIFKFK